MASGLRFRLPGPYHGAGEIQGSVGRAPTNGRRPRPQTAPFERLRPLLTRLARRAGAEQRRLPLEVRLARLAEPLVDARGQTVRQLARQVRPKRMHYERLALTGWAELQQELQQTAMDRAIVLGECRPTRDGSELPLEVVRLSRHARHERPSLGAPWIELRCALELPRGLGHRLPSQVQAGSQEPQVSAVSTALEHAFEEPDALLGAIRGQIQLSEHVADLRIELLGDERVEPLLCWSGSPRFELGSGEVEPSCSAGTRSRPRLLGLLQAQAAWPLDELSLVASEITTHPRAERTVELGRALPEGLGQRFGPQTSLA